MADCLSCVHSYQGNDLVMYCRVDKSAFGLKCSPEAAEDCKQFSREPGSDAEDAPPLWRGD